MKAWNKGKLVGAKRPLDAESVETLRRLLKRSGTVRDQALFELALSSMLRASDLLSLSVSDLAQDRIISSASDVKDEVTIRMKKTGKPVTFPVVDAAKEAIARLVEAEEKFAGDYLFTAARDAHGPPLSLQSYSKIVKQWCRMVGLPAGAFGTHSLRRTKAAEIYRRTGNLRAVQLLLGHSSISITQRYLGVETEDALKIARSIKL